MQKHNRPRLRPLQNGEVLDEAIELYKHNMLLFVSIAGLLYVPFVFFDPVLSSLNTYASAYSLGSFLVLIASTAWYLLVMSPIVTGSLTYAVGERYLGRQVSIGQCLRKALRLGTLGNLLVANLIEGASVGVATLVPLAFYGYGMTLLFASAQQRALGIVLLLAAVLTLALPLIVAGKLALAMPAIMMEKLSAIRAISRSLNLSSGRIVRIAGLLLVVFLTTSVLQGIVLVPSSAAVARGLFTGVEAPVAVKIVNMLVQVATGAFLMPAIPVVRVLLYLDSRVREEGYDLEIMAEEMALRGR